MTPNNYGILTSNTCLYICTYINVYYRDYLMHFICLLYCRKLNLMRFFNSISSIMQMIYAVLHCTTYKQGSCSSQWNSNKKDQVLFTKRLDCVAVYTHNTQAGNEWNQDDIWNRSQKHQCTLCSWKAWKSGLSGRYKWDYCQLFNVSFM